MDGDYRYPPQGGKPGDSGNGGPQPRSSLGVSSANPDAQPDPVYEDTKIFIGGLNVRLKTEDLQEYFEQFGPVVQVQAIKARGFGFVTFKNEEGVNACLQMRWHNINGHSLDVKRAKFNALVNNKQNGHDHKLFVSGLDSEVRSRHLSAYFESLNCRVISSSVVVVNNKGKGIGFVCFKESNDVQHALTFAKHEIFGKPIYVKEPTANSDPNKCKVFIGGLESSIDTPDLKKFFSAYGNVKDSIVCMDKHLRTSRGFGFITFATEEERQLTIEAQPIYIKDKRVEIKLALPKEEGALSSDANKLSRSWVDPTGPSSYSPTPGGEYGEECEAVIESSDPKQGTLWGDHPPPAPSSYAAAAPGSQQQSWQPYIPPPSEREVAQGRGQHYQPTYQSAHVSRLQSAKESYTPPPAPEPANGLDSQPSLVETLLRKLATVEDECNLLKKQVELNSAAIEKLNNVIFD
eukprot:CAMPEP_0197565872 /NCGR_PEP_ID=MMETSP1320-20131121/32927_1 /TAXON_ID=91990 /ORGANISM="Bolidomonas sp., Strain RCC2347" /LENGTH=461 /DNA_ID=CAMNT_0043127899 /DNA_START=240 /DNA_END=1625 /DNA_ORIENTATION=-